MDKPEMHPVHITTGATRRSQRAVELYDIAVDSQRDPGEREEARAKLAELLTKATGNPINVELKYDPVLGSGISIYVDQTRLRTKPKRRRLRR